MLYLECYSGISGDMTVAALLDLGADRKVLEQGLSSLCIDGYKIKIGRRNKCGISACDFDVILENEKKNGQASHMGEHSHTHIHDGMTEHTHNDAHKHGEVEAHAHSYEQLESHIHEHNHAHGEKSTSNHHSNHRNLSVILDIIEKSQITPGAKEIAEKIFRVVAEAESKAHGIPVEEVHFHEVGAIDSIVDIVGASICLDNLNIEEVVISDIYEGTGHVRCQHGIIPVPVPAVLNIVAAHELPLKITQQSGEMVTPTGAAIVAAIRNQKNLPDRYQIVKTGVGAGKKDFDKANILRAMIIEPGNSLDEDIWVIQTNLDDLSGELMGDTMEILFQAGAKDVYYTPIFMKKNRPAYQLSVICDRDLINEIEKIIFVHTTTIGIRKCPVERVTLDRTIEELQTPYGVAKVKKVTYEEHVFYYPEYESVKELAAHNHLDVKTMYRIIQNVTVK